MKTIILKVSGILQLKNTQHGFPIRTTNADPDKIINEKGDMNLKEELPS